MVREPAGEVASGVSRTIVLASRSPRRAELLAAAGISFEVLAADIDESARPAEDPAAYVERLAVEKARAVLALRPDAIVLGADTTVVVDGRMLGKPESERAAHEMLQALSGRAHEVLTGVAIVSRSSTWSAVERTRVWFHPLTNEDIQGYVQSGEPMDKAGAYGIQGIASRFIPRIEGSYTNVVGLPIALVSSILTKEQATRL